MRNPEYQLAAPLRFDPGHVTDPVPDWILRHLDVEVIADLARIHFDARRIAINAELEVLDRVQEVVGQGLRR